MTTLFTPQTPWGVSRRWNAWVEFHSGQTLVASSARGDFAVLSGRVTEDIGRKIRRDAQVTVLFPNQPHTSSMAVYSPAGGLAINTEANTAITAQTGVGLVTETSTPVIVPAVTATTHRSPFIPTALGDLLDPHSLTTMLIYAGFEGEEVLLGYFDLASTPVTVDSGGTVMEVTGHSFERRLDLASFWFMEIFPNDTNAVDAVLALFREAMPGHPFQATTTSATVGELTWTPGDNRLDKMLEMLAVGGLEAAFNRSNTFVISRSPTIIDVGQATSNWEILDGLNARVATLNSAKRTFSDDDSKNGVIVTGTSQSNDAPPVSAVAWNTNPSSPLYFDPANPSASAMGPRPKHISSELAKTTGEAQAIAQVELLKVLMVTDTVDAEVPANAQLEMGQYAHVVCDAMGADGIFRISRVVHDLAGGPAQVTLYRFFGG